MPQVIASLQTGYFHKFWLPPGVQVLTVIDNLGNHWQSSEAAVSIDPVWAKQTTQKPIYFSPIWSEENVIDMYVTIWNDCHVQNSFWATTAICDVLLQIVTVYFSWTNSNIQSLTLK